MDFTRASALTPEVEASIEDAFEYHKWTDAQVAAGARIRKALADAVKVIVTDVPPSPDRTTAIRKNSRGKNWIATRRSLTQANIKATQ